MEGRLSPAGYQQHPDDDGRQQGDHNKTADHPQLLPADTEDEVRVPGRQGPLPRLSLGALHVSLAEEAAGAQGQQAPGLLPACSQGIIGVVKQDPETVDHIVRHQAQSHRGGNGCPAAGEQQDEPPQSEACHKGHAQKDEEKCQAVAHIPGNPHVPPHQGDGVSRHHQGGGEGFQIPLHLPQPLQLLGQQQGEGDLHHLRRADAEGEKGKFQPCGVARVVRDAKGCQQQGDEHDVEGHKPLPPPHQPLQVQHGHEDIGADAQHHGRPLDAHISQDAPGAQVSGGAGDQRHAVQGGGAAEPQQHQVGLLDEVCQNGFQSVPHGRFHFLRRRI